MKKSGYLERRATVTGGKVQAAKDTYIQFMVDLFCIALNDKAVMGKDVLGAKRLGRVVEAVDRFYDKYSDAIESAGRNEEREALRVMLDNRLRRFAGDELIPFPQRYYWLIPERPLEPIKRHEQKIHPKAKKRRK